MKRVSYWEYVERSKKVVTAALETDDISERISGIEKGIDNLHIAIAKLHKEASRLKELRRRESRRGQKT